MGKKRGGDGKLAPKFDVYQFIETQETAREVLHDDIRERMTKDDFITLRTSKGVRPGKAESEWQAFLENPDKYAQHRNEEGELTVEVPMTKKVTYRSRFTQGQRTEGASKPKKDASQEEIDKTTRKLFMDLEKCPWMPRVGLPLI